MIPLVCITTLPHFPSVQSCIRIIQNIIMNYCSKTIDIILNQCYHFRVFSFHRGSAEIVLGFAQALPGWTEALPVSIWACQCHPGMTGEAPAWTVASPGLCLDGPERILCGNLGNTVVLPGYVWLQQQFHPGLSQIIPVTYRVGPWLYRE
jgi:hypothetical protein